MRFSEIKLAGAKVIDPNPHEDGRGRFMRAWCVREFATHGLDFVPVQANIGFSICKGTIRGLHFQVAPALEAKLIRCTRGAIFDVMVDLRPESPSYREWCGVELTAESGRMVYVPALCAHGYQTLEDNTDTSYEVGEFYTPEVESGLLHNDPALGLTWPLPVTVISDKDQAFAPLRRIEDELKRRMAC